MSARLMYEPTDPPAAPLVAVSPDAFDAIAAEGGAVIELDAGGRADVVRLRGVDYFVAVAS